VLSITGWIDPVVKRFIVGERVIVAPAIANKQGRCARMFATLLISTFAAAGQHPVESCSISPTILEFKCAFDIHFKQLCPLQSLFGLVEAHRSNCFSLHSQHYSKQVFQ
jgi:hypothetical protein